jgi:hypothetical protein
MPRRYRDTSGLAGKIQVTRHSKHPKFARNAKPKKAKSPRVPAEIHSNAPKTARDLSPAIIAGVTQDLDLRSTMGPKVNTNANRKHGGTGTFFKPRESAGYDLARPMTLASAPTVKPTGNRKPLPTVRKAKDESLAEALRQKAMQEHSARIGNGTPY